LTISRAYAGRNANPELQPWQLKLAYDLHDVPVLPETLLRLELEVQERCIDLRAMSQLVLNDLGATLQILRLAGHEYGVTQGRPSRIEDCIADLGVNACMEAMGAQTVARDSRSKVIHEAWAHSREIAHHSRLVAEELPEINPEEAYLVGLLHGIGLLPAILGWSGSEGGAIDGALVGFEMAKKWALPSVVVEFFSEIHLAGCVTLWPEIVRTAHQSASGSSIPCPFEEGIRPVLRWNS
jgi:HD-like signal output (HDOD) protein